MSERANDVYVDISDQPNGSSGSKGDVYKMLKTLIFIESTIFVCIMGLLITTLTVDRLRNSRIWDFEMWKWCFLILAVLCGRLIGYLLTLALVKLIWKFCSWRQWVERELYFAYGVKSIIVFIWLALVFLAWALLFNSGVKRSKDVKKIVNDVTRGLAGCLIGVAIWSVKTLLVKLLASFHVQTLFHRVKEANYNRKILEAFSKKKKVQQDTREELLNAIRDKKLPPLFGDCDLSKEINIEGEEGAKKAANEIFKKLAKRQSARAIGEGRQSMMVEGMQSIGNIPNLSPQSLLPVTSKPSPPTTSRGKYMPLKDLLDCIEKELVSPACQLVKKKMCIHCQVVKETRKHFLALAEDISFKDWVEQILKYHRGVVADDKASEEDKKRIKKSVFRNWVVKVYKDYESVNSALKYRKTAVDELNKLASVVVLFVIIIVWLLFMEYLSIKIVVFITSQLLLVAFMFGNTAKTVFEAIIFVFVMHPFEIGDRCLIDDKQMIVDEMEILTTTFLGSDNARICYPNSVLATKSISNFYRSPPPMLDSLEFAIRRDTEIELIKELQFVIKKYLESNPRRWRPDHSLQFKEIEGDNMKVILYFNHTLNFHDAAKRDKRRSDLVLDMNTIFEVLGIKDKDLSPLQFHLNSIGSMASAFPPPFMASEYPPPFMASEFPPPLMASAFPPPFMPSAFPPPFMRTAFL
ncbi:hypothetical protein GH714_038520 [Hevea brasiliensis]|uniref:Mechanosensitive ion channel MscS domain-containing protein n=1 Tax=Hevea brasiliensis TaxID=3981 RepID=A0A6A6KGG8_HEVBR|nr:hypothetical protein GH714_038520 [Hevea brasiliensis]